MRKDLVSSELIDNLLKKYVINNSRGECTLLPVLNRGEVLGTHIRMIQVQMFDLTVER